MLIKVCDFLWKKWLLEWQEKKKVWNWRHWFAVWKDTLDRLPGLCAFAKFSLECYTFIFLNDVSWLGEYSVKVKSTEAETSLYFSVSTCCECCTINLNQLLKAKLEEARIASSHLCLFLCVWKNPVEMGSCVWPLAWWAVHQPTAHRMWGTLMILKSVLSSEAVLQAFLWIWRARISCT